MVVLAIIYSTLGTFMSSGMPHPIAKAVKKTIITAKIANEGF